MELDMNTMAMIGFVVGLLTGFSIKEMYDDLNKSSIVKEFEIMYNEIVSLKENPNTAWIYWALYYIGLLTLIITLVFLIYISG